MFISPKFSLKECIVDGVKVILNSEEAKDLKKKYPQLIIHNLRKSTKTKKPNQLPSAVRYIDPQTYAKLA